MKRFLVALLAFCFTSSALAASGDIIQTVSDQWNGDSGTTPTLAFGVNVTAGNSIVCRVAGYDSAGFVNTAADDESTNVYAVPLDSSSGDADSGTAAPTTRALIWASHAVTGGWNDIELEGLAAGSYGFWRCDEIEALAASPNDRACSVQDVAPQASDAVCTIGTLSQAAELVMSVTAMVDGDDANLTISGPSGGPSWTNDAIFHNPLTVLGYSLDHGTTAATTTFNAQYSHVDIDGDWTIAVATFELASAAPAFDSGPTVTAVDSNTFRVTYDANADADTIECGAWLKDATAPTAAQIDAGTGARGTGTEASTGSSDTLDFDVTDNPAFPIYDVYCELEEGVNNYSSVGTQIDETLTAPSGYQHVNISGTLAGFLLGTGAAAGDITQGSTTVTPGSYALTIQADGDFSYAAGGDGSKQTFLAWYYDVSAGGWSDAARVTVCVNNSAPRISPTYSLEYSVVEDVAIPTFDLNVDSVDDNSDTITVAALSGSLPTGLSLASNDVTGTPTTPAVYRTVQRHTDECGVEDKLDVSHTWLIRQPRPLFVGLVPDLSFSVNNAIVAVDFTADFDHDDSMIDPTMDLTYSLLQLGSSSLVDTVNGTFTNAYVLTVDDSTGIVAGDYITTETDTDPHLVLAVYTNDLELATPIDAADNDDVSEVAVSAEAITGLAISAGGSLTGTPTVVGNHASLFVRAADASGEIKDTDLFDLLVMSTGSVGRISINIGIGI